MHTKSYTDLGLDLLDIHFGNVTGQRMVKNKKREKKKEFRQNLTLTLALIFLTSSTSRMLLFSLSCAA